METTEGMTCSFWPDLNCDVCRCIALLVCPLQTRRCWHRLSRCPRMMEAALGPRARWRRRSRSSYRRHSDPPDVRGTRQFCHINLHFPGDTGFLNSFFPDWYSWPAEQRLPFRYNALRTMYWWLDRKVWELKWDFICLWIRWIWSNNVLNPSPLAAVANQSLVCALNNTFMSHCAIDSWIRKNNASDRNESLHVFHPNPRCSFPGLRIQIQDIGNLCHLWRHRDEGAHCTCIVTFIYIYIICKTYSIYFGMI